MTFFDIFDRINADGMSSSLKSLFKESVDHAERNTQSDYSFSESKDIGIIMLSAHLCHELVAAESASDPLVFIANKRDADAGSANGDTSFSPAARYVFCNLYSGVNI